MSFLCNYCDHLEHNALLLNRIDGKFLLRQESRVAREAKRIFDKQLDYVLDKAKALPFKANSVSDDIDNFLNDLPDKLLMLETIVVYGKVSMEKGAKSTLQQLALRKFGIDFKLSHPSAVKYFQQRTSVELSDYKGSVNFTTKTRIKEILLESINTGRSYTDTAKLIEAQGKAGVFSRARAELIAVREIGDAYENGRLIPMQDFAGKYPDRPVYKYWSTVEDSKVTRQCQANQDEGWILLAKEFSSGDMVSPRDSNPRCRCTTLYEIRD